jgi:putative ABC transport system ATP-binding protein
MIRIEGITRNFGSGDSEVHILKGIDIVIESGEFAAIQGPSGSGKSTLLGIMAGLERPTSGRLYHDENQFTEMDEAALTRYRSENVGFIFQNFQLIPSLTALENVKIPLELAGHRIAPGRVEDMLASVGLEHRLGHFPNQLSGGEQQRVAIARALIHEPRTIFADEPTGNLDTKSGSRVMELLRNRAAGTTLILVTHDAEVAAMADRTITLRDGAVVEDRRNTRPIAGLGSSRARQEHGSPLAGLVSRLTGLFS